MLRGLGTISPLVAAALTFVGTSAAASEPSPPCELHVWAAARDQGQGRDPATLSDLDRSRIINVLDASQRLYEMEEARLSSSLGLPPDTLVFVHKHTKLDRKLAERSKARLSDSAAPCYFDWVFRDDAMFGPPPEPTIAFTEYHGQAYFHSVFKAFGVEGDTTFKVKGGHRARLVVLSGTAKEKNLVYDTQGATVQLIEHASEKIRDKLKGRSLLSVIQL